LLIWRWSFCGGGVLTGGHKPLPSLQTGLELLPVLYHYRSAVLFCFGCRHACRLLLLHFGWLQTCWNILPCCLPFLALVTAVCRACRPGAFGFTTLSAAIPATAADMPYHLFWVFFGDFSPFFFFCSLLLCSVDSVLACVSYCTNLNFLSFLHLLFSLYPVVQAWVMEVGGTPSRLGNLPPFCYLSPCCILTVCSAGDCLFWRSCLCLFVCAGGSLAFCILGAVPAGWAVPGLMCLSLFGGYNAVYL
jgi:hypothetical protein